jgi:DNA-binding NarL/FixJ family response regulator
MAIVCLWLLPVYSLEVLTPRFIGINTLGRMCVRQTEVVGYLIGVCVKIIVADDHALFREGLRHVLGMIESGAEIIEAADYATLRAVVDAHTDADLVLVDLNMPGAEPFADLRSLLSRHPTLLVVVLSASESASDMHRSLDAGAMGYIPKRENADIMLSALRLVLAGGVYIPPALLHSHANHPHKSAGAVSLTPRQLDVLRELVSGKGNKEIGQVLNLTESTVKVHVTAIFRALDVSNRTHAALAAEKLGLVSATP